MEAYGAWGEKTMYGKKTVGTIRSTFLVDAKGIIARAWYNVRADGHAAKVLAELRPLSRRALSVRAVGPDGAAQR